MLFNTYEFLAFFPAVLVVLFLLRGGWQRGWLLLASVAFYAAWDPRYLVLLGATIMSAHFGALQIERSAHSGARKLWVALPVVVSLGILFVFKYLGFVSSFALAPFGIAPPEFAFVLPIGISFYTFQALSYVIDVHRKKVSAEKSFWNTALYVSFFPQLVAGPIERPAHLMPQLKGQFKFEQANVVSGLRRMLWGFFKKLAVADIVAPYVDTVYANPAGFDGSVALFATLLFAFQVYCDFSGYSDIAIGAARCCGVEIMENFNRPYAAASVREFWQRWHISLSTWFRDYVYIPLGGSRSGIWRQMFAIAAAFTLSGLWHGASWTFVTWGALHGVFVLISICVHLLHKKHGVSLAVPRWLGISATFAILVFSLTFVRAETVGTAWLTIGSMASPWSWGADWLSAISDVPVKFPKSGIAAIIIMETVHLLCRGEKIDVLLERLPRTARWTFYYALIFWIVLFGAHGAAEFYYFQF